MGVIDCLDAGTGQVDSNGNILTEDDIAYTYDELNRLH
jgi:hypothetical protein